MVNLALLGPAHRRELDLLRRKLCGIHRLAQHLDRQLARLLQVAVLVVVLFQQTLRRSVVGAHACSLPAAVVAGGVGLVELELPLVVPAGIDERNTEGSETTVLRVALLQIAQAAHELLAGDVGVVGEEVALGGLAGVVDEDVGVGGHAGYGGDHFAGRSVSLAVVIVTRNATYSFKMYSFSALVSCSRSLLVTLRSAARTMPSFAKIPNAVPACEMASRAYSTW